MARRFHSGLKSVYALAVAAALAFGSKELLASPNAATAARACTISQCGTSCTDAGFDYGLCRNGVCQCYFRLCGGVQCR